VTSVIVLFLLVRRHRQARDRMERLLQFTSHELKTPIAGVRGLLQTLARNRVPEDARAGLLDEGVAACDRLEHLAETILAYQRAVASEGPPVVVRSDTLLDGVLAHRRRTLADEGIEAAGAEVAHLRVDVDAFRVVMENLLDNARKYGGGRTTVQTRLDGPTWSVSVRDEGQGFQAADAERLFEPFARGGNRGEAITHGSGLGLYLSRQLARRWGGDLCAESEGPGRGATFRLRVPVADGVRGESPR
jgi:signal transduction histidine kinase